MTDFFNEQASKAYDAKNSKLSAIADNMHFLIRLVLKDLPKEARILCVGVGTGAEILSLAAEYPQWHFVGVDPSRAMLDVCRARLQEAGIMERCELIHGYVQDVPLGETFDAAVSVLVGHFVKREDRIGFYQSMQQKTKPGGYVISTEISADLNAPESPSMLRNWERVQTLMGATPESLAALPDMLRDVLCVLPPGMVEDLMRAGGLRQPVRFFQSFMITGWYARKE